MMNVFSKMLCPIDFDRDSMEALDLATPIARQNSAEILLLAVIAAPIDAAIELPPVPLNPDSPFETEYLRRLDKLAREKLPGVPYRSLVASGNAAPQILKLVADSNVDLIVMGTHGRRGVKHFLLGSVAERVVRESPVPVLTVRPMPAE